MKPAILLAKSWDCSDATGWWMSTKLDGMRAYWTGRKLLSRDGNEIFAPAWFTEGLPAIALDGELWLGNNAFQETISILKSGDQEGWRRIRYMVFDAPEYGGEFEQRYTYLDHLLVAAGLSHVQIVPQTECRGADHIRRALAEVEAAGGEGLMLRQPGSHYEGKRSGTLLKVKSFHDAEARVVEHQPGKGKHRGKMGAITVKLDNGRTFNLGSGFSDLDRANPPAIGSVVTFRFQELTSAGIPRFASFVRPSPGLGPCEIPAEYFFRKHRPKPAKAKKPTASQAERKAKSREVAAQQPPYVNHEQMDVAFIWFEGNARQWSDQTRELYCEACRRTGIKETTGVEWLLFLYVHANAAGCPQRAPMGSPTDLQAKGMWINPKNWDNFHALIASATGILGEIGNFSTSAPKVKAPRARKSSGGGDAIGFLFSFVNTVARAFR